MATIADPYNKAASEMPHELEPRLPTIPARNAPPG
jgi:hypothetical protein